MLFNSNKKQVNEIVTIKRVSFDVNELNLATKRRITVQEIAKQLFEIMQNHLGQVNGITRAKLFKKIYGRDEDVEDIKDWLRWDFIKRAMRWMRQRTKIFIGAKNINGTYIYFVITDKEDARAYCDILQKNMDRMKLAQLKAIKAVQEAWYRDESNWLLPKSLKEIEMKLEDGN